MNPRRSFKVAAVSAAPVFMDRDATVEKACGLIAEAAGQGAELIVFPETFIPTYPMWVWEIPARYTMYAQGTQIYCAPTWDCADTWIATLRHIAKEGGVYVIGCGTPLQVGDIPDSYAFKDQYYGADDQWINTGDATIVDPTGEILAGPAHKSREIIYAEIETGAAQGVKWKLDVAGHYSRPDVFELIVNTDERPQLWKASTVDDVEFDSE